MNEWISRRQLHSSLESVVCERIILKRYTFLKSSKCFADVQLWIRMYDKTLTGSIRFCQKILKILNMAKCSICTLNFDNRSHYKPFTPRKYSLKKRSQVSPYFTRAIQLHSNAVFYFWTQYNVKGLKRYNVIRR